MKQLLAGVALSMLAVVSLAGGAKAQSITNLVAGRLDNGSYLWQYEVFNTGNRDISHWTLDVCRDVFDSLVVNSVKSGTSLNSLVTLSPGGGGFEFTTNDPTTGAKGIKFDNGFDGEASRIYEFRLNKDFTPTTTTVVFKGGNINNGGFIVTQTGVVAPGCTVVQPRIPEPGSVALIAGLLPVVGMVLRRKK
jgi:hypothetical protein